MGSPRSSTGHKSVVWNNIIRLTQLPGLLLSDPGVPVDLALVDAAQQVHGLPVLAHHTELDVLLLAFYSGEEKLMKLFIQH